MLYSPKSVDFFRGNVIFDCEYTKLFYILHKNAIFTR